MISPLVSVIMPTYNRAYTIINSINSVLNQEYQNIELIIIDDFSSDNTTELIHDINDSRVIYFKLEKNRGPAFARNIGMDKAQGDFIAFLDSDDVWLPNKLTLQIDTFQRFPHIDILFGNYLNINIINDQKAIGFDQTKKGLRILKTRRLSDNVFQIIDNFVEGILSSNFILLSTFIMKGNVVKKIGNLKEELIRAQDFEYFLRAGINNINYAYNTNILTKRYKDINSISVVSTFYLEYIIKILDIIYNDCIKLHKLELLPAINKSKRNTYQYMIKLNAIQGRRKDAIHSFIKCLEYGGSLHSIYFLAGAFMGPHLIKLIKRHYLNEGA